jgi:protein-arginine deiminase
MTMRTILPLFPALLVASCGDNDHTATDAGPDAPGGPVVEIRADTNRNGTIDWNDPTEQTMKDSWDAKHGAIFLANIDDDESMCPKKDMNNAVLSDVELAKCNDAADTVINGDADLLDLAPIETKPWPDAPADAVGKIAISDPASGFVHLFKRGADGTYTFFDPEVDSLTAAEIKAGAHFGIEAIDVVRDRNVWDGLAHVSFSVGDKTDTVVLRVAPVISRHHLDAERRIYHAKIPGDPGSTAFQTTLRDGMTKVLGSLPQDFLQPIDAAEKVGTSVLYDDQWTQDYFETGYMSMPIAGGKQHVIDVFIRSSNIYSKNKNNPLRPAGKIVFLKFRGPDAAGLQQFDPASHNPDSDSLDSMGNFETIPPYDKYPLGRMIRGNTKSFGPDPSFLRMMESQAVQPPVYVDTSWLLVGHIDETISFVKAATPRGWALLANDPRLAKKMLQDAAMNGNGNAVMFEGLTWDGQTPAQTTINQVLADMSVMTTSASAAASIDSQLAIIKKETGITDGEIVHIPFLHQDSLGLSVAYQPGTVNGLSFSESGFAAPDPHGPIINGKDIFKQQLETELGKLGIQVAWIEDWDLYHTLDGEVHCGTNSLRVVPDGEKWWESGY